MNFAYEQNYDNDSATEFGFCSELQNVANELGIDTSGLAFGLCEELDTQSLLAIKEALEKAIEQANQDKLKAMGRCCMGYEWLKVANGYRCAGGTHFCSDKELNG